MSDLRVSHNFVVLVCFAGESILAHEMHIHGVFLARDITIIFRCIGFNIV